MYIINKFFQALMCAAAAATAAAAPTSTVATNTTNLFVSSYAGNITTLSLSHCAESGYALKSIAVNGDCSPNPSWLTLDPQSKVLYCLDEGLDTVNGSLTSFLIKDDGSLDTVKKTLTLNGPVSGAIYNNRTSLALAHYGGSAVSSWHTPLDKPGSFSLIQDIPFTLAKPGPNPERQDAPHEHEAIVDPTGEYLLFPDLGADLVRVYSYQADGSLVAKEPLHVVPGSGPRHGAFFLPDGKPGGKTFLYIVTELGNTVTSYVVTYLPNRGGLGFKSVYESSVYGPLALPAGNAAAEVAVSPDSRFLVISNRNNTSFQLPNPDPKNATKIPSDSLSNFAINRDGSLSFLQLAPAGGSFPRQFAMNAVGDLIAVGLQMSSAVVIIHRDTLTGKIGNIVARMHVNGQVTCVRWNEKTFDGTYANV